jgi:hypothetical protein
MSDATDRPERHLGAVPDDQEELEALRVIYPAWRIARSDFGGLRAEWKSENSLKIHYVGGTSVHDLHKRLEVIEAARGDNE